MATGRVLQFDQSRGYGFIAADDGGEDVFLHASVFSGDMDTLVPGLRVEFQTMAGDRGRKAYAVHGSSQEQRALAVGGDTAAPGQGRPAAQAARAPDGDGGQDAEDEVLCDVLSEAEFVQDITSLLLESVPALTGAQILQVRQVMVEFGRKHGWLDS
jgi:cold shock CspA family protein